MKMDTRRSSPLANGVLRAVESKSLLRRTASLLHVMAMVLLFPAGVHGQSCSDVAAWAPWEHTLTSDRTYENPYRQVTVAVTFRSPQGESLQSYAYWDGGRAFKIRFLFPHPGMWQWSTTCSDAQNSGLHQRSGSVRVGQYVGTNPLFRHGGLKASTNGRYLMHADGTPFLWVADTPWSAFATATQEEWTKYLDNRRENGFSVLQLHCGGCWQWLGGLKTDRYGNSPFHGTGDGLYPNPDYWREVDRKLEAANERGFVVYICAVRQPGSGFPVDDRKQVALFARDLVARLMNRFVIYSPIADDLWSTQAEAAGRALRAATPIHLISAHPRFFLEPAIQAHSKPYIDLVGLQSGEGWQYDPYKKEPRKPWSPQLAARNAIEWPLTLYRLVPAKPVGNQEGPYDHPPYPNSQVQALPPRKAAYWSLTSGAVGFSYGCFGVWNWGRPVRWMPSYDFPSALDVPSAADMKRVAEFFGRIPWWTLEPRHDLILRQGDCWMKRMTLAKSPTGDLAVAYLADNAAITLDMTVFPDELRGMWFNPMTGQYRTAVGASASGDRQTFVRPSEWSEAVLLLTAEPVSPSGSAE